MRRTYIRLAATLVLTLAVLAPPPSAAQDWTAVWRVPEVVNYELTMEKIRKLLDVQRDMTALSASEPGVMAKIDTELKAMQKSRTATFAAAAGLLDGQPSVRNILAKNGLTARDWLAASGAMGTAAAYRLLEKQTTGTVGTSGSSPSAAQKANMALLKKNEAEWKKIEEEFIRLASESASRAKK